MSNRVVVEAYPEKNGYTDVKVADEYGVTIISLEGTIPTDNIEFAKLVRRKALETGNDTANDIFEFQQDFEKGLFINDEWYDFEQLIPVYSQP